MSRVITFSRVFPSYHPKKGEPTFFVEKVLRGIYEISDEVKKIMDMKVWASCDPKYHTIRAGNRWEVGDYFSPRVWSGKPYASKQIIIARDIEVKKVWDIVIDCGYEGWMDIFLNEIAATAFDNEQVAKNDGLSLVDFFDWFHDRKKLFTQRFEGQIICWNENINY